MKNKILKWYQQNLWTIEMVHSAVVKNIISKDEYFEITGKNFDN